MTRRSSRSLAVASAVLLLSPLAFSQVDITDLPGTVEAQYYISPGAEGIDNVVDNNPQTKFLTLHNAAWIRFNPAAPYHVVGYAITSANDNPERDPSAWTLEGSNDGAAWTLLDSRSGEFFSARFQRKAYTCTVTAACASYRLSMTCASGAILQLSEWELLTAPLGHDVAPVSITAPYTYPSAPINPLVTVGNNGSADESFSVVCRVDSEGVQVYSETMAVTALAPGTTRMLQFPLWTPGGNLSYTLTACTSLETDQVPANDQSVLVTNFRKRVYIVPYAHLDLQWSWTLETTINTLLPNTLHRNFALLDKYPAYCFNFEGAYRYSLIKQYYPQDYDTLKRYIAGGRWNPAGAMVEAVDVNIPSPEALIRQILYGNRFFQQEFGRTSDDLLLPDCFGFPCTLPTIAAHCGLRGFSSSKYDSWGGYRPSPFTIGQWEGVDGSRIVACLQPGSMWSTWEVRPKDVEALGERTGVYAAYDYLSVGDQGSAPPDTAVASLSARMLQNDTSAIEVLATPSDQLFRDLTDTQMSKLPVYKGELLLTTHGTGTYTVREDQKILNRADELSAFAAEQSSVLAEVAGGPAYPLDEIQRQWFAFLAHDFHDDLPGVCVPAAYDQFSTPVRQQALGSFTAIRDRAIRAVAANMDTRAENQAVSVVVWNPAAFDRHDIAEASIRFPGGIPASVRVYDAGGVEVPSQLRDAPGDSLRVLFAADVPAAGYAVYQVRSADSPSALPTGLRVTADVLENARYRVLIDENGDPSSIVDKQAQRELLAGPCRFALLNDAGGEWPAWEIQYTDVSAPPRAYAGAPVSKVVVDSGAAQVTLRITRTLEGSSCTHDYTLTADSNGFLRVTNTIDWKAANAAGSLLKLALPLTVANPSTTYDLGLGTIERGVNTADLYEVPAQQWADITQLDKSYGVALLNDCKYGWDKPADNIIRLTLIHSPFPDGMCYTGDRFVHHFAFGIYGHAGDWSTGGVISAAARLNQPLVAFQTGLHEGNLGKVFRFLTLDPGKIAVMALKKAENGDGYILRVREAAGKAWTGVTIDFTAALLSAKEVDGMEKEKGPVGSSTYGIAFSIGPYQLKTFSIQLGSLVTPLTVSRREDVPAAFDLLQNYPNPCNPSTVIRFALPADSRVRLDVYTVLGQRVMTLAEGVYPAGRHELELLTRTLASGTYFYRLEARPTGAAPGAFYSSVRKFLVLK